MKDENEGRIYIKKNTAAAKNKKPDEKRTIEEFVVAPYPVTEEVAAAKPKRKRVKKATQTPQVVNEYKAPEKDSLERERIIEEREKRIYEKKKAVEQELSLFTERDKPHNYYINLLFTTLKMLLVCIIIFGVSGLGAVLGMAKLYLESAPELDFSLVSSQDQSTILYDADGGLLQSYYSLENREWATLDEIPVYLQNAVIGIEDVRFRRHLGIDVKRLLSSFISNVSSGSLQGGSTLTQQLIKNTMLSFEQTYKRKLQEAYLALELERNYSKDQILEAYLNTIYMGGSSYGVKTAAMDYFGKELSSLSLRECATLAGLIQNPSRYNPRSNYYTRSMPERTDNRTNLVLYEMKENGLINAEEYDGALADTITVLEKSPYSQKNGSIYFIDYVIDNVIDKLIEIEKLDNTSEVRKQLRTRIRTGGYRIYTTLDSEKQTAAEKAVYEFNGYPEMRYDSDSYTITGRNPDGTVIKLVQPQAAAAIMDYRTGEVVAMVGGRQAPEGALQYNRSYQSTMPVGSSIKPIAVYGPAIELGGGPGTTYYNLKMKIQDWNSELGYPENNNRSAYYGQITMRQSIVASYNVTAAQALMYDVGIEKATQTLINLGVREDHISKTGSGLALGSSGITPIEMAAAFSAIANMGVYVQPKTFTKITDSEGNIVIDMEKQQTTRRVFSESTAWMLTDMLYSVVNSGGSGSNALVKGQTVYGKTGTNSENRGVFFAGFTGYYTGAVWIGSDAYKQLVSDAQGGKYAAPLFSEIMTALHSGLSNKKANTVNPADIGVKKVQYCRVSGKLAGGGCSNTVTEWGCPANMQQCDVHVQCKICTASGRIATTSCPEESCQTKYLTVVPQTGLLNYMYRNNYSTFSSYVGSAKKEMQACNVHTG